MRRSTGVTVDALAHTIKFAGLATEGGTILKISWQARRKQEATLETVALAWRHNPGMRLGQLMASAANISRGQLHMNPAHVTDEELLSGIRALVPHEWEVILDKENAQKAREKAKEDAKKGASSASSNENVAPKKAPEDRKEPKESGEQEQ